MWGVENTTGEQIPLQLPPDYRVGADNIVYDSEMQRALMSGDTIVSACLEPGRGAYVIARDDIRPVRAQ